MSLPVVFAGELAKPITREAIERLEDELRKAETVDVDSRTGHLFGPGFYVRTLTLKAGETLTGKVHSTEHIFMLTQGSILVATEDGAMQLDAPYQAVCRPGLKRAGHALTDCVCVNVHITNETDMARLEATLIEPERRLEASK